MPTLPVLRVTGNGDGTTHQPRGTWNNEDYARIDEDIASPDGVGIVGPFGTTGSTSFTLADTPATFVNMETLSVTARLRTQNRTDDNVSLQVKIVDTSGTVLAGGVGSGFQLVVLNSSATMTTLSPVAFATVNTTATKSQWDSAILQVNQGYVATGGADSFCSVVVDGIEITGTYAELTGSSGDVSGLGGVEGTGLIAPNGSGLVSGIGSPVGDGWVLMSAFGFVLGVGGAVGVGDAGFLPPALTARLTSSTSARLSWVLDPQASFYEIEREKWNGVGWADATLIVYDGVEGEYNDVGLVAQGRYRYRIRGVRG